MLSIEKYYEGGHGDRHGDRHRDRHRDRHAPPTPEKPKKIIHRI